MGIFTKLELYHLAPFYELISFKKTVTSERQIGVFRPQADIFHKYLTNKIIKETPFKSCGFTLQPYFLKYMPVFVVCSFLILSLPAEAQTFCVDVQENIGNNTKET